MSRAPGYILELNSEGNLWNPFFIRVLSSSQLTVQCVPRGLPKQLTNHFNLCPNLKCVYQYYNSAILNYGLQNRKLPCCTSFLWIYWLLKLLWGRIVYVLCHCVSLTILTSSFLLLCLWCLFGVIIVFVIDWGRHMTCLETSPFFRL